MSVANALQQQQEAFNASGQAYASLFLVSPARVLGLKRAAEPSQPEEEQRFAKTPKTAHKTASEAGDDEDEMRYPLRNRTPLSAMNAMKNLGVLGVSPGRYIPPSARMTRAGGSGVGGGGGIPTPRVTFPRHSENDAPTTALAASIPAPITTLAKPVGAAHGGGTLAAAAAAAVVPLAAICRTASLWKRKDGRAGALTSGT